MFYFIGIFLSLIVPGLAYFYLRIPLEKRSGFAYYTNGVFVYERYSDGGGWINFDLPDIVPFLRDKIVWGASPFSFKFVGDCSYSLDPTGGSTGSHIYKDNYHVIYQGKVIWDSDVGSLELFDGYATDKNRVYLRGHVSKRLDPETFELLGCGFWRDKQGVYNEFVGFEKPILEIDKDTFEVRDPRKCYTKGLYTAKDKNKFYKSDGVFGFRIIANIDQDEPNDSNSDLVLT